MTDSRAARIAASLTGAAGAATAADAATQTRIDRSDFFDEETGLPNLIVDLQDRREPGGGWDFHPNRGHGGNHGSHGSHGGGEGGNLGWYPFS